MSPDESLELQRQLRQYLANDQIEPANSPFGAGVLFAAKKDGSKRLCIDYRGLNNITVKDAYPLPRIDAALDYMVGSTIFTKLDLYSGYHQIRIHPKHCPRTAFNTEFGSFQFKVLPFGLCNAPATFQRMMNLIFADLLHKFVEVYIDDIVIYSTSPEQHLRHVGEVLHRLRREQLYCKLSKCQFGQNAIDFCGYRVSHNGIDVCEDKISLIQNFLAPTNIKEVRSFLVLCGFYQHFIPHYATLVLPTSVKPCLGIGTTNNKLHFNPLKIP